MKESGKKGSRHRDENIFMLTQSSHMKSKAKVNEKISIIPSFVEPRRVKALTQSYIILKSAQAAYLKIREMRRMMGKRGRRRRMMGKRGR